MWVARGEVPADGGGVGLRAVGDHHLHTSAPSAALLDEEAGQGLGVAVFHDGQHGAGLAVQQHRDVAMAAAQRGLIDHQHPAALSPPLGGHGLGPGPDHPHDEMPAQAVTAGQFPHRQLAHVGHQAAGQAAGDLAGQLRMLRA